MTPAEELKVLATKHRWALEELAYDCVMQSANHIAGTHLEYSEVDGDDRLYQRAEEKSEKLIFGPTQDLYNYLKEQYGSGMAVIKQVRFTVVNQKRRAKTLHIVPGFIPGGTGELID